MADGTEHAASVGVCGRVCVWMGVKRARRHESRGADPKPRCVETVVISLCSSAKWKVTLYCTHSGSTKLDIYYFQPLMRSSNKSF